jgi:hypothetical protein
MWNISPKMAAVSRARLAWCPLEYRKDYLQTARKVSAAEARQITLDTIARDRRAIMAGMPA